MRRWIVPCLVAASALTVAATDRSDPKAVAIAETVLERLGGDEAWSATGFVRWDFFGGRTHYWDKQRGDVRIEIPERLDDAGEQVRPELLVLMNINTREGRVWATGQEVADADQRADYLEQGHQIWINDSYWMFMPYKLLDPGVTLRYSGERALEDGRACDVLDLTFGDDVGYTPNNRYEVFVARDTGLVEQWSFFADSADEEPRFTLPWSGWKQFGGIRLATDHGQEKDWRIAVEDDLPRTLFTE